MDAERSRASRFAVSVSDVTIGRFRSEQGAWHETPEEVAAGLAWGREKARLLRWVRSQMTMRLTLCERRCIELYYFEGLTYREAADLTATNPSSVYRAVQRSLRKLRVAAANHELRRLRGPRRRVFRRV